MKPATRTEQLRFETFERPVERGRPLVKLDSVADFLHMEADPMKELYESRALEFSFDLSGHDAMRCEVRIWRGSLIAYLYTSVHAALPGKPVALADVIKECLPPGRGPIKLSQLCRLWSISSTHAHDLVAEGALARVPGQKLSATATPFLTRESCAAFLEARRIKG